MTYESSKQLLVKFYGSSSPTSPLSVATAGGLCGLVSWACVSRILGYWIHDGLTNIRFIRLIRQKHTINVTV